MCVDILLARAACAISEAVRRRRGALRGLLGSRSCRRLPSRSHGFLRRSAALKGRRYLYFRLRRRLCNPVLKLSIQMDRDLPRRGLSCQFHALAPAACARDSSEGRGGLRGFSGGGSLRGRPSFREIRCNRILPSRGFPPLQEALPSRPWTGLYSRVCERVLSQIQRLPFYRLLKLVPVFPYGLFQINWGFRFK